MSHQWKEGLTPEQVTELEELMENLRGREHFFISEDSSENWTEVTREEFIRIEQANGFFSKFGFDHPATGGFSANGVRGKVTYGPEEKA